MSFKTEVKHYTARADIWWAQRQRAERERRERQLAEGRRWQAERAEHARKLAAGEVAMPQGWYQHPTEPPGLHRWWDGNGWTEFRQQARGTGTTSIGATSFPSRGGETGTPGWLKESALFQAAAAGLFGPLFVALFAVGASLAAATMAALVVSLAIPIIGWFFLFPLVLMCAFAAAALWAAAAFALACLWGLVALTMFVVAAVRSRRQD